MTSNILMAEGARVPLGIRPIGAAQTHTHQPTAEHPDGTFGTVVSCFSGRVSFSALADDVFHWLIFSLRIVGRG